MRLADKVAIVTGGAAGIGEAIVHKFVAEGASVVLADLPDMPVDDTIDLVTERGGQAIAYRGDLSEPDGAADCVQAALDAFGRIDILVSNAAVLPQVAAVAEFDLNSFDYLMKNNTRSAFLMTKTALPELRRTRGAIVYTGSIGGIHGTARLAAYCGSKAFVHALMQAVAQEEASHGVRANALAPGSISSAWNTPGHGGPVSAEMTAASANVVPLGRTGTPEEMANVACFLASDEASYMTGALVVADGGLTGARGSPGSQVPDALRQEPDPRFPHPHRTSGFIGKHVIGPVGTAG